MNEYFQTFQNITETAEKTLTGEPISLELKQSATQLKKSVLPCFEELRQSATRLKDLVHVGVNELDRVEDVWYSKPRITEASKLEIWEQLGDISGRAFKIPLLGSQSKSKVLKQAKDSWNERYELLKKTWFIDAKTYKLKDVAVWEKNQLIQDIRLNLDLQAKDLNLMLKKSLTSIYQELQAINLEQIQYYASLLPQQSKDDFAAQTNLKVSEIEADFIISAQNMPRSLNKFSDDINPALKTFAEQGFISINLEHFAKFSKEQVLSKIEKIVNSVFDDRVKLATGAIEQAIAFYNAFLERQERYQQETPEQREAEKAWIDKQRQELARVQHGIEAILNQSPPRN